MTELTLEAVLAGITALDGAWLENARARSAQLVMPTRALGRLHDIAERLCAMRRTLSPSVAVKAILVMAGDHGVVAEGVSAYPQEVTGAMVHTFLAGGAGINALARHVGARVRVVDMGIIPELEPGAVGDAGALRVSKVARGTANLARGPAMSRQAAATAVMSGFKHAAELFEAGVDILGTGDMGIGNTTPSAAIGMLFTGASAESMVGRGTGVDETVLAHKRAVVRRGLDVNRPDPGDGLDVLAKVGGFEIGGIAGCALAAAFYRRPLVVDGFISTAGVLVADALCPTVRDYLFAGHCSAETGHRRMLQHLGLEPLLDLGMRLGEGTGGAMAMGVIEGAVRAFCDVLTFEQAGVPDKES